MGKKSTPKPPDLGPYARAMEEQGRYSYLAAQDQLAWAREQDALNRELLQEVLGPQLAAQQEQQQWAQQDRARYQQLYQPLEENLIREFESYGSPERLARSRGAAMADVAGSFDAQRRNALQRLESYGVDPSQTRNAALDLSMRTQQGAQMAAAATQAQRVDEAQGRALRSEAINIGRGYPGQYAQQYAQSVGAGAAAMGGANQTFATGAGAMGNPTSWMGMGMQGMQGAGNMMSQGFQNQMAAYNAQQQASAGMMSGIGALAGMFIADGTPGGLPPRAPPGPVNYGPSDGTGIDDQVPATLMGPGNQPQNARISVGEYVIPADVHAKLGTAYFDRLLEKHHTPAAEQRQEMADGKPPRAITV